MAPASKRSSHPEEMLKTESAPQNSITVAAGTAAAPASSDGGDIHSAGGSPATPKKSTNAVVGEDIPVIASSNNRDGSGQNGHTMPRVLVDNRSVGRNYYDDYEFSDLDEITVRQLNEDICAYKYDLEYCKAQLEEADLNPQETRTLQLRTLDLGHQMRHCKHRIETIKAQTRKRTLHPTYRTALAMSYAGNSSVGSSSHQARTGGAGSGVGMGPLLPGGRAATTLALANGKRPSGMMDEEGEGAKRMKLASPEMDGMGGGGGEGGSDDGINTVLQRLGFWKCRLCSAPKYLLAGAGRTPAAPCKWPLKDISKMITHFTEMHTEHTPVERCAELGAALAQNRGPFEYWLRRTRAQNISDSSVIENCVNTLLLGDMPDLLRRHSRAAAGMPSS